MTYNTAKELLIQLQCCNHTITKEQVDAITLVISILDDLDVQPVKRGQWIISNLYAHCSVCSVAYDLDTFQKLIPMNENVPRHCSCCGADMRGEENG